MSRIQGKDTKPEMIVRRLVHGLGYRYRLHRRNLPGCPDLVFPGRKKVIFVHGCFWHRHSCRNGKVTPATRREFWIDKLQGNRERDMRNIQNLKKLGWKVLIIWECQVRKTDRLIDKITEFLSD